MDTIKCVVAIELNGLGVNRERLNEMLDIIKEQADSIEKQAFKLAGRKFCFLSNKEVSKVSNNIF